MDDNRVAPIAAWVTRVGLAGVAELDLLRGFCERAVAAGLPLSRATVIIDTLHPIHEGRAFRWGVDQPVGGVMIEFGRTNEGEAAENWRRSPLNHLFQSGASTLRRCFARGDPADFPALEALRSEGETDYLALIQRFAADGVVGEMDCVYSYWTTKAPGGFRDGDIAALERLVPPLALAVKCGALARIATTLVETYLGRDAGRRVLAGRIARGVADRIDAVLWFSDLRGFTHLTEAADPSEIIPFLNDYAEATITSRVRGRRRCAQAHRRRHAGDLHGRRSGRACVSALRAEALMRERVSALNERRREAAPAAYEALSRPAYRRGALWQYRRQRPARLHGRRPGGQRGEPHRRDVPLGGAGGAGLVRFRCGAGARSGRGLSRSAVTPCAASDARRICSRWSGEMSSEH